MPALHLRSLKVDVTPPVGGHLCGGCHPPSLGIETPLYLRGLILDAGAARYVLASIDFCTVNGASHRRFVEALAAAAGVPQAHIALHTTHVHDAPLINEETHRWLKAEPPVHDESYFQRVLADCGAAVAEAVREPGIAIEDVAFSRQRVEKFASARRVLDGEGHCQTRWSSCQEVPLKNAPEGRIDPDLDQVVFYSAGSEAVAAISFYACHPQVANGRNLVSSDCVGTALELFERTHPGVFPMYFTGCAGDVTAGKYSSPNRSRNRLEFGLRLFDAMEGAFTTAQPSPLQSVDWRETVTSIPLATPLYSADELLAMLNDPASPLNIKYGAATHYDRLQRGVGTYPFRAVRLSLNEVALLFMPSEMVIDYQLFAKSLGAGPLAVAAYGDGFFSYLPTDTMFGEGGYEVWPTSTAVAPGIEAVLKNAIRETLR